MKQYFADQLYEVMHAVAAAYTAERRRIRPGHKAKPVNVFEKAARIVMRLGALPTVYVRAQFADGKAPNANAMGSDASIARYRRLLENLKTSTGAARRHRIDIEYFGVLTQRYPLERVLTDPDNGLSPLFRVCLGRAAGIKETERWFPDAIAQGLLSNYAPFYGRWLPEELRLTYEDLNGTG